MEGMGNMEGGHKMGYTHMTFFWGKDSEILFSGWPAASAGMYALALLFVFFLGVLVEWLSHSHPGHAIAILSGFSSSSSSCSSSRRNSVIIGLIQTASYSLRVGFAYILMLAVMSFNGGVLLVAVAGHAIGFFLFGSGAFRTTKPEASGKAALSSDPSSCGC